MSGEFSPRIESSKTSVQDESKLPETDFKQQKMKSRKEPQGKAAYGPPPKTEQRYWNEFDDGDEYSQSEPYTIFIDPQASSTFPGMTMISYFAKSAKSSTQRIKSWLRGEQSSEAERQSLIEGRRTTSSSSDESSDLESGRQYTVQSWKDSHGRILFSQGSQIRTRDTWLTGTSVAALLISYILLFLVMVLVATGRRKAVATTDVGVLVGAAFSLALAFGGLIALSLRRPTKWIWWAIAVLLFVSSIVGNGVLLAIVL